jgi:hypothetical protein
MHRFAVLVCAAVLSVSSAFAAEECPPLKLVASVGMLPLKSGRVAIPVKVAGEEQYFVLATAVPMTSINRRYAEAKGFPREHSNVKFVDLGGEVADKLATVPSFGLGRLMAGSTSLVLTEGGGQPLPDGGFTAGVLGADFLRGYDVELDFGSLKLNLISRQHCNNEPVYWDSATMAKLEITVTDTDKISFPMELDGHRMQTVLNTGIPMSTLNMRVAKEVFGLDAGSAGNRPEGWLNKDTQLFSHQFQSLGAEGLKIDNPRIVLLPDLADQKIRHLQVMQSMHRIPLKQQPDLVLGLRELRQLHIYIDYHHQTLYLTQATPPAKAQD